MAQMLSIARRVWIGLTDSVWLETCRAHEPALTRLMSLSRGRERSRDEDLSEFGFSIDDETMKIIRHKDADPRDVPVINSSQDLATPTSPPTPMLSTGGLPVVKMRVTDQWYQKLPIIHIKASFNNTIFTITDCHGKVLAWASSGAAGFKNARRGTTFAAQSAAMTAAKKARELGFQKVQVKLKGPGQGRKPSIKALEGGGLQVVSIQDVTGVPHNGCRPRKARRL